MFYFVTFLLSVVNVLLFSVSSEMYSISCVQYGCISICLFSKTNLLFCYFYLASVSVNFLFQLVLVILLLLSLVLFSLIAKAKFQFSVCNIHILSLYFS